jgi:tripeptidyl-peptidase-1
MLKLLARPRRCVLLFAVVAGTVMSTVTHFQMPRLNGWETFIGVDLALEPVCFTLAVKQQNIKRLKHIALDVSNPASKNFGKFLTNAEIEEITRPTAESMAAVTDWLDTQACCYTIEASNVIVETSVEKAELMLRTRFQSLINRRFKQSVVRAGNYILPDQVHSNIDAVFGLHGLPLPPKRKRLQAEPVITDDYFPAVTPKVIADYYKIGGVNITRSENRQAVAEFQGEYMNSSDLSTFFKQYVPGAQAGDDTVTKFVGGHTSGEGVEALLDIQ